MFKKKVTSLLLSLVMIGSCLPLGSALADTDKNKNPPVKRGVFQFRAKP